MRIAAALATVCLLLITVPVWAQGEVRGTEVGAAEDEETVGESRIAKIHAVERGLWFLVDYGPYYQIPIGLPQQMCLPCIGSQVGVRLGYDILNNIEADVFLRASYANFLIEYAKVYSGDVASYYAGVGARFSYITTDRFHATVRAGVGPVMMFPSEAAGTQFSFAADAAAGVEYFTRLRHLSIGCELSTIAYFIPFSVGFSLSPTIKYTF